MCGIIGLLGNQASKENRLDLIQKMTSSLQHRGPDGWGIYLSPEVVFGQTRLSIVDLKHGDQPMTIGQYVMVYNGEIFNYIELREELEKDGIQFSTTSDSEVLLRAYIQYGNECFKKLNGQFAVLIWNKNTKELTLTRDRFGIRPLYYTNFKNQIYFGSEMKVFDQIPGFQRNFDHSQLFNHALLWNTLGDKTVYKGINSLPSGTYAIFKNGVLTTQKKYYELGRSPKIQFDSYAHAESAFKDLMDDAVKLRLRSDVPVGAYLSGGIDSSIILNLISKHTTNAYKTFSVTFQDKEYDESGYQQEMVRQINSEHHEVNISYDKIDEAFMETIYHGERPIFRTAPTPLYLLSEEVQKNDIKVVLTGEGADEILWGYDSFKEVKLLEFWSKFPDSKLRPLLIKKLYPHLNHYKDEQQYGMMRMFYEGFLGEMGNSMASANIRIHNNKIIQNYFDKNHNIKYSKDQLLKEFDTHLPAGYNKWGILKKNQFTEMKTLLAGYLLSSQGDRMSLAHSVEGRYPFLDHRVVDLLFHMRENYKLNGFDQKFLLKKAYGKDIPQSIINRPKRPYMSPDLRSFIRNGKLTENASYFLSDRLINEYQIFNSKWVQRFLSKFKNGIPDNLGYRDNMIITFMLSTQIANYWAKNPKTNPLPADHLTVKIDDY